MAKNNWVAGEVGTVSKMNQPYFLASGVISGGHLQLQIGPGRMRFPYRGLTVHSQGAQAVQINNVQANRFYSIFLLANGNFTVSGSTSTAPPGCPEPNGEYLGMVATGASVSTANLVGPWNNGDGFHELRGEYVAMMPAVPRLMDEQRLPHGTAEAVLSDLAVRSHGAIPSDADPLSGLRIGQVRIGQPTGSYAVAHATVTWAPSGALIPNGYTASGLLNVALMMALQRDAGEAECVTIDHRQYMTPQNPDGAPPVHCQRHTSAFSAVLLTSGADDFSTFTLRVSTSPQFGDDAVGGRVYGSSLIVEPGKARRPT